MNNPKLWTKDFLIVSSANFFLFLTFYLLMVTLSVYTLEEFHASNSEAGLASGIFVVGALLARPFAGKWIEVIGRKKMLYSALVLFLIATICYFFDSSLPLLLGNRFIHGIAFGMATTATGTIVADIIPNARRGEGTGYYAMSTNLAMAIGPFLGLFLSQHVGYSMVFVASSCFAVLSLLACLFLRVPATNLTKAQLQEMKGFKVKDFFELSALPISIVAAFIGFTYASILSFLTTYSKEIGLLDIASFFFVVYAVFLLASRPFTGRLFDLRGENIVIYPSFVLYIIGLLLLSQVHQGWMMLVAGAFIGIGFGTFQSSAQAISVKEAPSHRIGLATSTYYVLFDFGVGFGPFLMGSFLSFTGFRGLYESMAAIVAFCVLLYFFLHGKKAVTRNKYNLANTN